MLNLDSLRVDLEMILALAEADSGRSAAITASTCKDWLRRINDEIKAGRALLEDAPRMPSPPPKPLDLGGIPMDSDRGKADSR